jgi:hypothetical protein
LMSVALRHRFLIDNATRYLTGCLETESFSAANRCGDR